MKLKELQDQLSKFNPEDEVRIMNVAIEDNETCPTFEIEQIEQFTKANQRVITLQYTDGIFTDDSVNIEPK